MKCVQYVILSKITVSMSPALIPSLIQPVFHRTRTMKKAEYCYTPLFLQWCWDINVNLQFNASETVYDMAHMYELYSMVWLVWWRAVLWKEVLQWQLYCSFVIPQWLYVSGKGIKSRWESSRVVVITAMTKVLAAFLLLNVAVCRSRRIITEVSFRDKNGASLVNYSIHKLVYNN